MAASIPAPVGRTRRRTPDRERSRTAILDAAYRLFSSRGFMATTLNEIARDAGVAKGLVTFHFTSKEDMFREVLTRVVPTLLSGIEDVDPADPRCAADMFADAVRSIYANVVKRPDGLALLRLLVSEGHRAPSVTAAYHREVVGRGNAALTRILDIGVARGEFEGARDSHDSRILIGPIVLALFWGLLFDDFEKIDVDQHCERHIALALNGLLRRR